MAYPPGSVTFRPLSMADCDACIAVENAAFVNPDHRASPDKFAYRLTVCPELCMGVFVRDAATDANTLVGHILATRGAGPVIADADMTMPSNWQEALMTAAAAAPGSDATGAADSPPQQPGHQPAGPVVGVHSLAIVPSAQGKGLGTQLMRAYLDRMAQMTAAAAASPSSGGHNRVERVAILCQDYLVAYYAKLGFTNLGPSAAQFGGGGWHDMVYDIPQS